MATAGSCAASFYANVSAACVSSNVGANRAARRDARDRVQVAGALSGRTKQALADASLRLVRSPRVFDPSIALLIVRLHRRCVTQAPVARSVGVLGWQLCQLRAEQRAGPSKLSESEFASDGAPRARRIRRSPHIDIIELGNIERHSHALRAIGATRVH